MILPPKIMLACAVVNIAIAIAVYFTAKLLASKSKNPKRIAWSAVAIWYLIPLLMLWYARSYFPMPKDDYMVNLFEENKEDFEKIVKEYREEYLIGNNLVEWDYRPETRAIEKRLGIKQVTYRSDMNWFENPYSADSAKSHFDRVRQGEFTPVRDKRMKSVIIDIQGSMQSSMRAAGFITKSYLHFPMEAKIESGKLYYPYNHLFESNDQPFMYMRQSLDQYQSDWDRGQCFLKKIERQWFIQLCRSD